jgi:hypothetical protein
MKLTTDCKRPPFVHPCVEVASVHLARVPAVCASVPLADLHRRESGLIAGSGTRVPHSTSASTDRSRIGENTACTSATYSVFPVGLTPAQPPSVGGSAVPLPVELQQWWHRRDRIGALLGVFELENLVLTEKERVGLAVLSAHQDIPRETSRFLPHKNVADVLQAPT